MPCKSNPDPLAARLKAQGARPNALGGSVLWGLAMVGLNLFPACDQESSIDVVVPRPSAERILEPALAESIELPLDAAEKALAAGVVELAADRLMEVGYRYDAGTVYDLALIAYQSVCSLQPGRQEALVSLARMEQDFGNTDKALEYLKRVDEQESKGAKGASVCWHRGLLYLSKDDLDAAELEFERATELAPEDISGWIGLARVSLQRGQYDRAESQLQEALTLKPADSYVCELLARVYTARGAWQEAKGALAQRGAGTAAWRDPWRERVLDYAVGFGNAMRRAEALLAAGRMEEALTTLDQLALEQPANAALSSMRAFAMLELGQTKEALDLVNTALVRSPEQFRLHLNRALILQRLGDSRGGLKEAQEVVKLLPGYAAGHALVAELFADVGAFGPARDALETARKLGAPARVLRTVGDILTRKQAGR